jgi:hypothetical protein
MSWEWERGSRRRSRNGLGGMCDSQSSRSDPRKRTQIGLSEYYSNLPKIPLLNVRAILA